MRARQRGPGEKERHTERERETLIFFAIHDLSSPYTLRFDNLERNITYFSLSTASFSQFYPASLLLCSIFTSAHPVTKRIFENGALERKALYTLHDFMQRWTDGSTEITIPACQILTFPLKYGVIVQEKLTVLCAACSYSKAIVVKYSMCSGEY